MKHTFRLASFFVTMSSGASLAAGDVPVEAPVAEAASAQETVVEGPSTEHDDDATLRLDPAAPAPPAEDVDSTTHDDGGHETSTVDASSQPPVDATAANPVDAAPTSSHATPSSLIDVRLFDGRGPFRFAAQAELGVLAVASHTLQFGTQGTRLDYVAEGGQDSLFPFARLAAEASIADHHHLVFLYQPLTLQTSVTTERAVRLYDTVFDEGTSLRLKYGFDFVRASYLYDFLAAPEQELSLGVSLQLRNAIIDFTGGDGSTFVSSRNVGPVPILKARWRYTFDNAAFIGAEIDGFYANIPIANGDLESSVQGAVCDASLRVGIPVTGFANAYLNLRYIGGGSEGTEIGGDEVDGDGYADNWLHTFSTSLGFELR